MAWYLSATPMDRYPVAADTAVTLSTAKVSLSPTLCSAQQLHAVVAFLMFIMTIRNRSGEDPQSSFPSAVLSRLCGSSGSTNAFKRPGR